MKRRQFITLLGGAVASVPFVARAQQGDRVHRIGVPISLAESDPEAQANVVALREGLRQFGGSRDATFGPIIAGGSASPNGPARRQGSCWRCHRT
jgi:hypothetical protein